MSDKDCECVNWCSDGLHVREEMLANHHFSCPFQSTRPRGARRGDDAEEIERQQFQSTRPRGARPNWLCT